MTTDQIRNHDPITLTIAVCTYQRADLLARMLDSIQGQTYQNFDILVLDDCSNDGTQALCEARVGGRFRYVRNATNLGFNANYNRALTLATTSHVLLTHDDDYMDPDFVAYLVAGVARYPDALLVSTNVRLVDETNALQHPPATPSAFQNGGTAYKQSPVALKLESDLVFSPGEFWKAHYDGAGIIFCPTFCFDRQRTLNAKITFESIGPGSDTLIGIRINSVGILVVLAEARFNVCTHAGQDHTSVTNDLTAGYRLDRVAVPMQAANPCLASGGDAARFSLTYHFAKAAAAALLGLPSPLYPVADTTIEQRYARLAESIPHGFKSAVFSCGRNRVAARLFQQDPALLTTPRIDAADWIARVPQLSPHLRRWHLANFSALDRVEDLLATPARLSAARPRFLTDRTIVIWGVSYLGLVLIELLRRLHIPVAGLVDRSPRLHGVAYRELICRSWEDTLGSIAPADREVLILTGVEGALEVEVALDLLPYRKTVPPILVRSWRTAIDLIEEAAAHANHA